MGNFPNSNLFIRFYTSCGGTQNMWIEKDGCDGMRYQVDTIEDVKHSFGQYILQISDKNTAKYDMRC